MSDSIIVTHGALDEIGKEVVIRGVIDPSSLSKLHIPPYQREIGSSHSISALAQAIRDGNVPDITLGMRGGQFMERGGNIYLQDETYIIDGLQRRSAALELLRAGELPHLGAIVYTNTNEAMERKLFRLLNTSQSRLSPNVLLRNDKFDNDFVAMMYELTKDPAFVLHHKVCWNQRMKREELITAAGLLKFTARLHSRFRKGLMETGLSTLADNMKAVMDHLGRKVVRKNIMSYWEAIDESFDVRNVTFKASSSYLRAVFNMELSRLFANYQDFWKDVDFYISPDMKRKLSLFPITDPHIAGLCSSSGPSRDILYNLLLQHLNKGRSTRRLKPFSQQFDEPEVEEVEVNEDGEEEIQEQEEEPVRRRKIKAA